MEFSATIEDPVSLKRWVKCLQHISRLGQDEIGFVITHEEVSLFKNIKGDQSSNSNHS